MIGKLTACSNGCQKNMLKILSNARVFIQCCYILGTRDIKSDDGKTKTAETGNSGQTEQVMAFIQHPLDEMEFDRLLGN